MCAEHLVSITVEANTLRKAQIIAEKKLSKTYFYLSLQGFKEVE